MPQWRQSSRFTSAADVVPMRYLAARLVDTPRELYQHRIIRPVIAVGAPMDPQPIRLPRRRLKCHLELVCRLRCRDVDLLRACVFLAHDGAASGRLVGSDRPLADMGLRRSRLQNDVAVGRVRHLFGREHRLRPTAPTRRRASAPRRANNPTLPTRITRPPSDIGKPVAWRGPTPSNRTAVGSMWQGPDGPVISGGEETRAKTQPRGKTASISAHSGQLSELATAARQLRVLSGLKGLHGPYKLARVSSM